MGGREMRKIVAVLVMCVLFFLSGRVNAAGHDGFFLGGGYQQLFMYTTEHQLTFAGANSSKITFGPGFGANILIGYDLTKSRWGFQFPFEYSYLKLNKTEYVHYFGFSTEGILHLRWWKNGVDLNLVGGIGYSNLLEGPVDNNTNAQGINFGVGPGFNYFFARDKIKGSIYVQMPIRMVYFFGNNLSASHTIALSVPIRIGLSIGF